MAPGRGADVPTAHFAKLHKDLVDVVLVYTMTTAFGSSSDSTAAPVTSVLLVILACLLGATIASTNLRYWAPKSPLR